MILDLRPGHLEATYEYLRAFKPFCRWKLPPGDEVEFRVTRDPNAAGFYQPGWGCHQIGVSARCAGTHVTVQKIMAHEMVHLKQQLAGTATAAMHNADFHRCAQRVCRAWGWDRQDFYC